MYTFFRRDSDRTLARGLRTNEAIRSSADARADATARQRLQRPRSRMSTGAVDHEESPHVVVQTTPLSRFCSKRLETGQGSERCLEIPAPTHRGGGPVARSRQLVREPRRRYVDEILDPPFGVTPDRPSETSRESDSSRRVEAWLPGSFSGTVSG